jgi:hypothetical protein
MNNSKLISFFICLSIYYFFFWEETLGINLFLFNILLMAILFPSIPKNLKSYLLMSSGIISSLAVLLIHSPLSIVINLLSMSVILGYTLLPSVNSAVSGGLVFASNIFINLIYFFRPINWLAQNISKGNLRAEKIIKVIKIVFVPVTLFLVFVFIYQNANPIFDEKTTYFKELIGLFFEKLPTFSLERTFYTLFGYILLMAVFFKNEISILHNPLSNNRFNLSPAEEIKSNDSYWIAFSTLLTLNFLLFYVNSLDIQHLWLNFDGSTAPEMSKLVHSGTYLLIFSILLSILVLLIIFRGPLNFHKNTNLLKFFSFVWLAQNALLLFSVAIRNYKYVELYGLTFKRIGVYVFLILTLLGLISLVIKIYKNLNFRFLIFANSWAYMAFFIFLSFVDFDNLIAKNNLERNDCDINYIKTLRPSVLPIVNKYYPEFKPTDFYSFEYHLQNQKKQTLLSWNFSDHQFKKYLKKITP